MLGTLLPVTPALCQWPAAGHCAPPTPSPFPNPSAARRGGQTPTRRPRHLSGASAAGTVASGGNCCLEPGTTDGCQSVPRCGVNPKNATPCSTPSTDLLSLGNLKVGVYGAQGRRPRCLRRPRPPRSRWVVVCNAAAVDLSTCNSHPACMISTTVQGSVQGSVQG